MRNHLIEVQNQHSVVQIIHLVCARLHMFTKNPGNRFTGYLGLLRNSSKYDFLAHRLLFR